VAIAITPVIAGHLKATDSKSDEEESGKRLPLCKIQIWTPVNPCLSQRVASILFVDLRMKSLKDFHFLIYCQLYIITASLGKFLLASCPVFHFRPNFSPSLLNSVKYFLIQEDGWIVTA